MKKPEKKKGGFFFFFSEVAKAPWLLPFYFVFGLFIFAFLG